MTRYTQDGYNIKGPGLPEQGCVAVGPGELEKAFEAGKIDGKAFRAGKLAGYSTGLMEAFRKMRGKFCPSCGFGAVVVSVDSHKANKQP